MFGFCLIQTAKLDVTNGSDDRTRERERAQRKCSSNDTDDARLTGSRYFASITVNFIAFYPVDRN